MKNITIGTCDYFNEVVIRVIEDNAFLSRSDFYRIATMEGMQLVKEYIADFDKYFGDVEYYAEPKVFTINMFKEDIVEIDEFVEDFKMIMSRSEFIRFATLLKLIDIVKQKREEEIQLQQEEAQRKLEAEAAALPEAQAPMSETYRVKYGKTMGNNHQQHYTPRISKEKFEMLLEGGVLK